MPLNKIGNLIIPVTDLERSRKFYCETLGMKQVGSVPGEFAFLDAGGMTLALRETDNTVVKCGCEYSFQVEDINAAYQELSAKGVHFSQKPRMVTGDAKRQLFATDFRDPDGHILSINGWVVKG